MRKLELRRGTRVLRPILACCLFLMGGGARAQEPSTIRVLVSEGYTPGRDAWDDIHVELARTLVEKADFKVSFRGLPWSRALVDLQTGKVDLITYLSRTPEREPYVHFVGISTYEQSVLVVKKGKGMAPIKTLEDLVVPKRVWGIQQDVWYSDAFNERFDGDPAFRKSFETVTKLVQNLDKVKGGRIDGAFVENVAKMKHLLKTSPDYKELTLLQVPFLPASPVYFGFSKTLPEATIRRLQKTYDALQRQHAFEKVVARWTD